MNTIIKNKDGRRSVARTALLVLSFLAAIVLVAPNVVFAQITGQLSQDCEYALVGNDHTITATVTDGGVPYTGGSVFFYVDNPGSVVVPSFLTPDFDENGIATFPHTVSTVREVTVTLYTVGADFSWIPLDNITTTWTDDEADLCPDPQAAPSVKVGGQVTLNAKKNGTFRIAFCSVDGLDVKDVNLKTVQLVGVKPWRSYLKDSRLCPNGKDGVKDLVFKFKNREVVEALEKSKAKELEDGDLVDLTLTLRLKDGTSLDGTWEAIIKKEGKMHRKKNHHQKKDEKVKGPKK